MMIGSLWKNGIAFWLILFFLVWNTISMSRRQEYGYADGSVMYRVTESLVENGSLKSRVPGLYRGNEFIGHSKYGLGFSIVSIPVYILFRELGLLFTPESLESWTRRSLMVTNIIITSLFYGIYYLFLSGIFKNCKISLLLTFILGMTTIYWPYSHSDFSEPLAVLCLILSSYYLFGFHNSNGTSNNFSIRNGMSRDYLWSGIWLGLAVLTRIVSVSLIPVWLIFLIYRERQLLSMNSHDFLKSTELWKKIGILTFPLIISGLVILWYNHYRYGSIFLTGYEGDLNDPRIVHIFWTGLYGLLISPGKGLFWYNPVLIIYLISIPLFYRKSTPLFLFTHLIFLIHLVIYAGWWAWEGGWCWGPRNLIPAIPFLLIGLGYWLKEYIFMEGNRTIDNNPLSTLDYKIHLSFLILLCLAGFWIQFIGQAIPYTYYIDLLLKQKVNYDDIWMVPSYSPIIGHLNMVIWGLPPHLWDFILIPIFKPMPYFGVMIFVTLMLVTFFIIGSGIYRNLNFEKRKSAGT